MTTKANCYICGCDVSKIQATRHLAKCMNEGKAKCMLIKVEDAWNKDYWIYFDMPITDTLYDPKEYIQKYILSDKTGKLSTEYDDIIAHTRLWILNGRMPYEVDKY